MKQLVYLAQRYPYKYEDIEKLFFSLSDDFRKTEIALDICIHAGISIQAFLNNKTGYYQALL